MQRLRSIVNDPDTRAGRTFALVIQSLILVSVISFSVETLPDLSSGARELLRWIEVVTVAIFTVEYLLRLIVAPNKLRYIFSFYGLVDLLAILPFYISSRVDLRAIRILRMLRLLRIFRIERLRLAMARYRDAFLRIRSELAIFLMVTLLLLYVSGIGIYYFENEAQPEVYQSIFHSLWWSVITLTTVGYGDMVPVTLGGRIFTFVILILGLGIVAVPTGLVASALSVSFHPEDDRPTG